MNQTKLAISDETAKRILSEWLKDALRQPIYRWTSTLTDKEKLRIENVYAQDRVDRKCKKQKKLKRLRGRRELQSVSDGGRLNHLERIVMIKINGKEILDIPQGSSDTVGYRWIVNEAHPDVNPHLQPHPVVTFTTLDGETGTVNYLGRGPVTEGTEYTVTSQSET